MPASARIFAIHQVIFCGADGILIGVILIVFPFSL